MGKLTFVSQTTGRLFTLPPLQMNPIHSLSPSLPLIAVPCPSSTTNQKAPSPPQLRLQEDDEGARNRRRTQEEDCVFAAKQMTTYPSTVQDAKSIAGDVAVKNTGPMTVCGLPLKFHLGAASASLKVHTKRSTAPSMSSARSVRYMAPSISSSTIAVTPPLAPPLLTIRTATFTISLTLKHLREDGLREGVML